MRLSMKLIIPSIQQGSYDESWSVGITPTLRAGRAAGLSVALLCLFSFSYRLPLGEWDPGKV
jgi:hypothetical protein